MLINKKGNTTIITQEKATMVALVQQIEGNYETYKNDNLIVNVFSLKNISGQEIAEFLRLAKRHSAGGHSFVIVNNHLAIDAIPEGLIVVPTLLEAHDLIQMEEIERDLGF